MLPGQLALTFPPDRSATRPAEPIERTALIGGADNELRWSLRRRWADGPCVAWCGLNPSRADGSIDDPTMLREMGFSFRWGFGSLVKVNVYPFRSPSPVALAEWRKRLGRNDIVLRDAAERAAAAIAGCDLFIAAWGNGAEPDDLARWLAMVERALGCPIAWHCLGTNADGSPRHTLSRGRNRVPDDMIPVYWSPSR
ncbi:DUF1643 domain-containing protein [Kaistia dalseonensis]|uniref:DUF1643 domain-containing protein n=1 Tax=Kaistia dalseonensis TaxID=410840 RepID=A0ABU0H7V9_9HYPH|nr:DUF1643 domain-containing protein [Kaistia dalseonensis]MCX5495760.1 DUF1643 domain-containing protein [Kaistia dalseonensis]MDQ0438360.1 hypothetical protein [Kaistia dalseonensis]